MDTARLQQYVVNLQHVGARVRHVNVMHSPRGSHRGYVIFYIIDDDPRIRYIGPNMIHDTTWTCSDICRPVKSNKLEV